MSNPFESNNPWQSTGPGAGGGGAGPAYGNAYDSEPAYGNSSYNNNNAYSQPPTNSTPGFSATGYNNAWGDESNKTQYDNSNAYNQQQQPAYGQPPQPSPYMSPPPQPAYPPQMQSPYASHQQIGQQQQQQPSPSPMSPAGGDAYQFAGTRYGNQPPAAQASAYSNAPVSTPTKPVNQPAAAADTTSVGPDPWNGEAYHTPNKYRIWLRFVMLITSIGHLGFAAGAQPYSHEKPPFSTAACFYYLFAVAAASIVWALYHVLFYCYRRMFKKPKMNRPIMFAIDLLFAVLWGIGIIVEIAKFRCGVTGKFCSFYNVSIFWGFVAFVAYIACAVWDVYGSMSGCCTRRK